VGWGHVGVKPSNSLLAGPGFNPGVAGNLGRVCPPPGHPWNAQFGMGRVLPPQLNSIGSQLRMQPKGSTPRYNLTSSLKSSGQVWGPPWAPASWVLLEGQQAPWAPKSQPVNGGGVDKAVGPGMGILLSGPNPTQGMGAGCPGCPPGFPRSIGMRG